MGEAAKKIGDKLEEFAGNNLLPRLGWQELLRDFEFACTRSTHKNTKGKDKKTHGIDLLSRFDDPYSVAGQAVIIECKNRQMASIKKAGEVSNWVTELINCIECAQSAPELRGIDYGTAVLTTGLLLIHANDSFDEKEFDSVLRGLQVKGRKLPINIFIASNREIYQWSSMFNEIGLEFRDGEFDFLYPSISGSSKVLSRHIPINALFSRFLFAQHRYIEDTNYGDGKLSLPKEDSIMFSFDDISLESFRYAWSIFKHYQMEGADRYIFYFYPRQNSDFQYLTRDNFLNAIDPDGTKIKAAERIKIGLKILDNRSLSPVDTEKGMIS